MKKEILEQRKKEGIEKSTLVGVHEELKKEVIKNDEKSNKYKEKTDDQLQVPDRHAQENSGLRCRSDADK